MSYKSCTPDQLLGVSRQFALTGMSVERLLACQNPTSYKTLDVYFFCNLLKKNPYLGNDGFVDATLKDFYEAEARANLYNDKFYQLLQNEKLRSYLIEWRNEVHWILGDYKPSKPYVTRGATASLGKGNTFLERFANPLATYEMALYLDKLKNESNTEDTDYPWITYGLGVCKGEIVPKTALVGRLVGLPCEVNAFEQTRVGRAMTHRLKMKTGIDFENAQDIHRRLAYRASIDGSCTTDDQKWASPLVYVALSKFLAPESWWLAMHATRDHYIDLPDGNRVSLARVATEGNNWCFPWETIVFLGLLRVAAKHCKVRRNDPRIRVFGDDLIYPSVMTELVRRIGRNVGFITNVEKSYSTGPFRESCGGDYISGIDVRPVYLKRDVNTAYDLTLMANELYNLQVKHDWQLPLIKQVWLKLIRRIYAGFTRKAVLWGPPEMGCLAGRPPENWSTDLSKDPTSCRELIYTWQNIATDKVSFRTLAYGRDQRFVLDCVVSGKMRGWGYIVQPAQKLPRWMFGPPKPEKTVYPSLPASGTRYRAKKVQTQLFHCSNGVDEDYPLSVFNILPNTRCPIRLYANEQWRRYERASCLTEIANLLKKRLVELQTNQDQSILVIDV